METITLHTSTTHPQVDTILQGLIGLLETVFPHRVRAYYLVGSFATQSAVPLSDLDGLVVFKPPADAADAALCRTIIQHCARISPYRIDFVPRDEHDLFTHGSVTLKRASLLLYGEDIREQVPLEPFTTYLSRAYAGFCFYTAMLRGQPGTLHAPLTYPDPTDEFYGYTHQGLYITDKVVPGTRTLINSTSLGATVLLGLRTGQSVGSKWEAVETYAVTINDEWAAFLQTLYHQCKTQWQYRLPEQPQARQALHDLCRQILAFENRVLTEAGVYLATVLETGTSEQKLLMLQTLQQVMYRDRTVIECLQSLTHHRDREIRQAANTLITRWHPIGQAPRGRTG